MEFGWKMINFLHSLARWPISNWKSAQICANLNSSKKQNEHRNVNFQKKCNFEGWNDGIGPKNDQPLTKSCSFTYFQSKSCINLCESEFWLKIKWAPNRKFLKKCYFGGRNNRIWLKNDESFTESCSLTHFQLKRCTNLCEFQFQHKTKWTAKQKFSKKAIW